MIQNLDPRYGDIPSVVGRRSAPLVCAVLALRLVFLLGLLAPAVDLGAPPSGHDSLAPWGASSLRFFGVSRSLDTADRNAVVAFYQSEYRSSVGLPMGWDGSVDQCIAGTNSQAYGEATLRRVNYYRTMTGLPEVLELDSEWNRKCQSAALMMAAEGRLSHNPDHSWACYSPEGAEAAAKSNLYHGRGGPEAIDGYMDDFGPFNYPVGHRRWILFPPLRKIGTGSIPLVSGRIGANCMWVVGGDGPRPSEPAMVPWPSAGFFPYQILPKVSMRWSLSVAGADFSQSSVRMERSGTNVPLAAAPLSNTHGYADNTIVWVPEGVPTHALAEDITYAVVVGDVRVAGSARTYRYEVTLVDAESMLVAPRITTEPVSQTVAFGENVTFQAQAEGSPPLSYQWFHDGNPFPSQSTPALELKGVTSSQAGSYRMVVTNATGKDETASVLLVVLAPQPAVFQGIRQEGDQVVVEWSGLGQLQSGATVEGPWEDVPGATSPTRLPIGRGASFFRVSIAL